LEDLDLDHELFGIALARRAFVESTRTEAEYARRAISNAAEQLARLTVQETGDPVFVIRPLKGIRLELAIQPGVMPEHHVELENRAIPILRWVDPSPADSGDHHPQGIIIARGPGIRQGHRLDSASVLDVAPTILALMGTPVAEDLDGRVLFEALTERFIASNPIRSVDSFGGVRPDTTTIELDEESKKKLRALGYVQ
jgi:hypothetical protein